MKRISSFKLDRKKKISILLNELKKFIENFPYNGFYKQYLASLEKNILIPQNTLISESKIILFKNFINQKGKFNKRFHFKFLFFDIIYFFSFIIYVIFYSKKITNSKRKTFELLVDDIDKNNSPDRFFSLKKKFSTIFIFNSKKNNYKKLNIYNFLKYKNCSRDIFFLKHPTNIVFIFFKTLVFSLLTLNNLFPFTLDFIKKILKYETIFSEINSNFLIQERHYNTSEIKNFIFKKKGGKKTCVVQKNILQMNGVGMYIYCDFFFSLGKNTADQLRKFGGKVEKIIPVGSLAMEMNFYKRKEVKLPKYDVLIFASDHNKSFHSGYDNYYNEYLAHYDWIKNFSKRFPEYKLGIKLKKIITDQNVIKKFQNIKNVDFLFDRGFHSDSYYYGKNAKALCTWSSTLAFEFLGSRRKVYFLDPKFKNISFLPNTNFIKMFKIPTYNEFEFKMLKMIKKTNERMIHSKSLSKKFCFYSKNTSENIYSFLKKNN